MHEFKTFLPGVTLCQAKAEGNALLNFFGPVRRHSDINSGLFNEVLQPFFI